MSETQKIEWTAPPDVAEWQRKEARACLYRFWASTTKWCWSLWLIGLIAAWIGGRQAYTPTEFNRFFLSFCYLGLFFPTVYSFLMLAPLLPITFFSRPYRYELSDTGLRSAGAVIAWNRLDQFRFADHPELPGIRVLEFTRKPVTRREKRAVRWRSFYFDPAVVDETVFQAYIEQRLKREASGV